MEQKKRVLVPDVGGTSERKMDLEEEGPEGPLELRTDGNFRR